MEELKFIIKCDLSQTQLGKSRRICISGSPKTEPNIFESVETLSFQNLCGKLNLPYLTRLKDFVRSVESHMTPCSCCILVSPVAKCNCVRRAAANAVPFNVGQ